MIESEYSHIPKGQSEDFTAEDKDEEQAEYSKISRRKFLKAVGLGITGIAVGGSLPMVYEGAYNSLEKESLEKEINSLEKELKNKYGVEIKVWDEHPDRPMDVIKEGLKERSLYRSVKSLLLVKQELEHYPPELIRNYVRSIEIVYNLRPTTSGAVAKDATPQASTSFGGVITIRAGHRSPESYHAVFGDVFTPQYLHHEISHVLTRDVDKNEWIKIHPDAKYIGNEWVKLKQRPAGFANTYATLSIDEDIATTAELLFTNHAEVESLMVGDDILQRKIELIKKDYENKGVYLK